MLNGSHNRRVKLQNLWLPELKAQRGDPVNWLKIKQKSAGSALVQGLQ
jgi:hypothetical protein